MLVFVCVVERPADSQSCRHRAHDATVPDTRRHQLTTAATVPPHSSTSSDTTSSGNCGSRDDETMTSDVTSQQQPAAAAVVRQPSYLSAVDRADELRFRDDPATRLAASRCCRGLVLVDRPSSSSSFGMCAVSETEEYDQRQRQQRGSSSAGGPSVTASHRRSVQDCSMVATRLNEPDTSKVMLLLFFITP